MIKIGVTGTFCAGKDTFAEYLKSKGFEHVSLSDIIREEAVARNMGLTRENLRKLGNEMREKEGTDVLAKKALSKMNDGKKYVITSIRNPLEVKHIASSKSFVLINIDAPIEERFKRMIARGRKESEPATFEDFVAAENKEMNSMDKNGQSIQECIKMSKFSILNDSGKNDFYIRIDQILPSIEKEALYVRPTWDEYFMDLARTVGTRGTCNRGRSGCIIVKDKRVMTTGYVGSPPGLAHCDEIGHWFKKTIHEDGSISQHCIRTVHAEANAIAQAAKHGINIDGGTLYCKMEPCLDCTKLLISAGIKRIVCEQRYHAAKESREMLEEAGVKVEVLNDSVVEYANQK